MQVIFCYSKHVPRAVEAVKLHAPDAEHVDTSGSVFDYNEAIASRWGLGEDLVVIEDDKVITAGVLPSFASCPEPWCVFSYDNFPAPYTRHITIGLGCAKFSAAVQREFSPAEFLVPDDPGWGTCPDCAGAGCWRFLDSRIGKCLWARGHKSHVHGQVEHLHEYPADWGETTGRWLDGGPVEIYTAEIRRVRR